ncbi:MAG: ABC transporter substrate-binding protein [Sphaerochaetaceae bacterium]|nr:ABC transporter substrate-binding protein [Bacteroidales bacterium]
MKKILVLCSVFLAASMALFANGTKETKSTLSPSAGKDISMEISFITHKQGMEDLFARYQKEFNEQYPNVKIIYEPTPDYKSNIVLRWSNDNWGDMCMIPHVFLPQDELPDHFASLGPLSEYENVYEFASAFAYDGQVYGISSTGTAYGMLYNVKVLKDAGVDSLPENPKEFYEAMRKVKAKGEAIPLYCDYGAGSRLADWEWNARGSLTGDSDYKNKLCYMVEPFAKGKPYYEVLQILYNCVKEGLCEDDPATSKWDSCKNLLANYQCACTCIGSWACVDAQKLCKNPDDIVFAAFPWNTDGRQYATIAADYAYAINKTVTGAKYQVCKDYITYLTEKSNFSYDTGGIPIVKGQTYPKTLKSLQDNNVKLIIDNPPKQQDIGLFDELNSESELYLGKYQQKARIVEAAMGQSKETFDEIMDDWNKRWTAAQIKIIGSDYATRNPY